MTHDRSIGILMVVPDDWDGVVTTRHHVARHLAARFQVAWLEPAAEWRQAWADGRARNATPRWHEPLPDLQVIVPGSLQPQLHRPQWLADLSLRSRLRAARRRLLATGAQRIVLYLWRDSFHRALDLIEHDASCYHIDDEYSFDERDPPTSRVEEDLLRRVSQVFIHSRELLRKKGSYNLHTVRVTNGVDYPAYASPQPVPVDLSPIAAPRIGYAGVIKKQLDLAAGKACGFPA
jgi:hypothetical protein